MQVERGPDRRVVVTPEYLEVWQQGVRRLLKAVGKAYTLNVMDAADLVEQKLMQMGCNPDDSSTIVEVLKGRDLQVDEAQRILDRYPKSTPLMDAMTALIDEAQ